VPFSNRVQDGKYSFEGKSYQIAPNMLPHPHPLHGHGWTKTWEARERQDRSAVLAFEYAGADYPSTYAATQRFELSADSLAIEFELRNTGDRAMPGGLGLHPFFVKTDDVRLTMAARTVWLGTDDGIPVSRVDVPARWDFSTPRELGDVQLDNCFGGWNKQAVVEWPSRGLRVRLTADGPAEHTVVYSPPGQPFFCVEPVTNANNAFNLHARGVKDVGFQILKPGETLSLTMKLAVERS
jgi:aldose 1-epimerase